MKAQTRQSKTVKQKKAVPQSWRKAAGLLFGQKKVNGVDYQKSIRREWRARCIS